MTVLLSDIGGTALAAFQVALGAKNLALCFIGCGVGLAAGRMSSISGTALASLALPLAYGLDPAGAVILLAALMLGQAAGRRDATPDGSNEAMSVSAFDEVKTPLLATILSIVAGGVALAFIEWQRPNIMRMTLQFGPAEQVAIIALSLAWVLNLHRRTASVMRNGAMVVTGLLLASAGTDVASGQERLTFGASSLSDGLDLAGLAFGLFGMAGLALNTSACGHLPADRPARVPFSDWSDLPPLFLFAMPVTAFAALLQGIMTVHGIAPGPQMAASQPGLYYGFFASLSVALVALYVLGLERLSRTLGRLKVPYRFMLPAIVTFGCIGIYAIQNAGLDASALPLLLVAGFGLVGVALTLSGFTIPLVLVGFMLGRLLEEKLRAALALTNGDFGAVVRRPAVMVLLSIAAVLVAATAFRSHRRRTGPHRTRPRP
jgi:TctA family transporter